MRDPIPAIALEYGDCTARHCRENRCNLSLNGIGDRVIIHGSRYQERYRYDRSLCDRIIFAQHDGFVLSAVELKSGRSIELSRAVNQIQNGLTVAQEILENREVTEWIPLLLYSGRITPHELQILDLRTVRFRGERKRVIKADCGAMLREVIARSRQVRRR